MINESQFIGSFQLPREGWLEPIKLSDLKYGFSVYKLRERPGYKSLFRVFIEEKELINDDPIKPLTVTATYGKENDDGSITISSTEFEKGIDWPLNLVSNTEFSFDIINNKFIFNDLKNIEPLDILKKVDRAHMSSEFDSIVKLKLYSHKLVQEIIKIVFHFVAWMHYLLTNKKFKIHSDFRENSRHLGIDEAKNKQTEGQIIDIFGVKVPVSVAVVYSSVHLAVFAFCYQINKYPLFLSVIFNNNFLTLMYAIFTVALFKKIFPLSSGLFSLLKMIQHLYLTVASMKIYIKIV
ncbi:MAG: hypothetical protein V4606_02535 [Patescibacteria group bacterium]